MLAMRLQAHFYLYVGIFAISCFATIHYYLYLRLEEAGRSKNISRFLLLGIPRDYLKLRKHLNGSPWPAYLLGPILVIGLMLLVVGIFAL